MENLIIPIDRARRSVLGTRIEEFGRAPERIRPGNTFPGNLDSKEKKSKNRFYKRQVLAMENLIIAIDRARGDVLITQLEEFCGSF